MVIALGGFVGRAASVFIPHKSQDLPVADAASIRVDRSMINWPRPPLRGLNKLQDDRLGMDVHCGDHPTTLFSSFP